MMSATPPGSQGQQQAIMKYLPIMFGVIGINFPAGLIVYWSSQSLFQIGQQVIMLRLGHIGPEALERRKAEIAQRSSTEKTKMSIMDRLSARAEDAQRSRTPAQGSGKGGSGSTKGSGKPSGGDAAKRPTKGAQPSKKAANKAPNNGDRQKPAKGAPPGNQLKKKR
jgi:hypothetical protein